MNILSYNFEDRINRVINNHQFTCEHRSHYLFVLKGFDAFIDKIKLNVESFNPEELHTHKNFAITYHDALSLSSDIVNTIHNESYDVWIVDYNFIPNKWLIKDDNGIDFVESFEPLSFAEERKTLPVFNTSNSLIGIVSNPDTERSDQDYCDLMKDLL